MYTLTPSGELDAPPLSAVPTNVWGDDLELFTPVNTTDVSPSTSVRDLPDIPSLLRWFRTERHWYAHLFQHVELLVPESELEDILRAASTLVIGKAVSDGGCKDEKGSFGWLVSHNGRRLLRGWGLIPHLSDLHSSFRAEAYGVASVSWFIVVLHEFFELPLPSRLRWVFHCDNQGVLKRLQKFRNRCHKMSDYTATDADVILLALQGLQRLDNCDIRHVKGHQDTRKRDQPLSHYEQLNVDADALATQALSRRPPTSTPLFAGCPAQFYIEDKLITAKLEQRINAAYTTPDLRLYLNSTYGWTGSTVDLVHWEAHGRALRSLSDKRRLLVTKFIHGWLPVGKQAHRYNSAIDASCPFCCCPVETQLHFCKCRHPDVAEHWLLFAKVLRRTLQRLHTEPTLQRVILYQFSPLLREDTPAPNLPTCSLDWITDQDRLGWTQLLFGRFASSLIYYQDDYLKKLPIDHRRFSGISWAVKFSSTVWNHVATLWKLRCDRKYGSTLSERLDISKAQLLCRIKQLYTSVHLLHPLDQQLFPPFEELRRKRLSTLRTWVDLVEPLLKLHRTTHTGILPSSSQPTLHDFFPPGSSSPSLPN